MEAVAWGLGFTQVQKKNGKEYASVRWETVRRYLSDIGFPSNLGKGDYIPENVFYRLAMKAKNEKAEKFQAFVADEIIPSVRKHGAYMTAKTIEEILCNPDTIIRLATTLKAEQEKSRKLQEKIELDAPKVEFYDAVADSKSAMPMDEVAKVLNFKGYGRNNLFEFLRQKKVLMSNNIPYQRYVDAGYFKVVEKKFDKNGETVIYAKTLVFQKGIEYIRRLVACSNVQC